MSWLALQLDDEDEDEAVDETDTLDNRFGLLGIGGGALSEFSRSHNWRPLGLRVTGIAGTWPLWELTKLFLQSGKFRRLLLYLVLFGSPSEEFLPLGMGGILGESPSAEILPEGMVGIFGEIGGGSGPVPCPNSISPELFENVEALDDLPITDFRGGNGGTG